MTSILKKVREILDQNLTDNKMNSGFLDEAYQQIIKNWHGENTTSKKNWELRFIPLPKDISKQKKGHRTTAEVLLERTIAKAFDGKNILWNQMPVASGLVKSLSKGNGKGKRRAIDLIYKPDTSKNTYEFLELKVANNKKDTPRSAAIEVIEYGLLYLFSRLHAEELGYNTHPKKPILGASCIGLRVLAEKKYYENFEGNYLPLDKLSTAFKEFIKSKSKELGKLKMDFRFETFSSNFICPEIDRDKLNENLMSSLRDAIRNKEPYSIKSIR